MRNNIKENGILINYQQVQDKFLSIIDRDLCGHQVIIFMLFSNYRMFKKDNSQRKVSSNSYQHYFNKFRIRIASNENIYIPYQFICTNKLLNIY